MARPGTAWHGMARRGMVWFYGVKFGGRRIDATNEKSIFEACAYLRFREIFIRDTTAGYEPQPVYRLAQAQGTRMDWI